jgi:cytoskeletal protein RodZ
MATQPPGAPVEPGHGTKPSRAGGRRRRIIAAIAATVVLFLVVGGVLAAVTATNRSSPTSPDKSASPTSSSSASVSSSPASPSQGSASPNPSTPAAPVAITAPATIKAGLIAEITKFEAVEGKAQTPGEVSGPSVRMTVTITNSTSASANLDTTVVTAYYGSSQTPALELSAPGGAPLPAKVEAGQAVTGVYIFTIPAEQRNNVRVVVDYSVKVQPLVFQGALPL